MQYSFGQGKFEKGHLEGYKERACCFLNMEWNNSYSFYTANEGPMRIQYKRLVPIYVFPEMKLCSLHISKIEL